MHKTVLLFLFTLSFSSYARAQCCSAGSGSPIAGGASQGVLQGRQMELNLNHQYVSTTKFLNGDSTDINYLDRYYGNYAYFKAAYGITRDFTLSVESGYYFNKTQIGLDRRDTIESKGFGDLIIFPRYDVLNHTEEKKRTEITLGLGWKIPLGKYNDSLKQVEPFSGETYYVRKPPAVQPSSGANDFIFYAFLFRGYPLKKFNLFSSIIYIHKGWNAIGEKNGDFASIGLFASKTLIGNLGLTVQVRGEWIDKMKVNPVLFQNGYYNYDTEATGSKKIFITPQVTYSFAPFTIYLLSEFPVYQYVNGSQIASQYLITSGISYRFFPHKGITLHVPKD